MTVPKYLYISLLALIGLALFKKFSSTTSSSSPTSVRNETRQLKTITDSSFQKDIVENTKDDVFVTYKTNWCGYCQEFKPVWLELSKIDIPEVKIAEVDCQENKQLCSSQNITGYPTLIYYPKNSKGKGTRYKGSRELDNLKMFINQQL